MSEPFVAVLMGSDSDLPVMESTFDVLRSLNVPFEARITSAHRTPAQTQAYVALVQVEGLAMGTDHQNLAPTMQTIRVCLSSLHPQTEETQVKE